MSEHKPTEAQHEVEVSEEELESVSGGTLGVLATLIDYVLPAEPDTATAPPQR